MLPLETAGPKAKSPEDAVNTAIILLRDFPHALTVEETTYVQQCKQALPIGTKHIQTPPQALSTDNPSLPLASFMERETLSPWTLNGSSIFWKQTRANVMAAMTKMYSQTPEQIQSIYSHRNPRFHGAGTTLPYATDNPLYAQVEAFMKSQLLEVSGHFVDHCILMYGGSGVGKTYNMQLSVHHSCTGHV